MQLLCDLFSFLFCKRQQGFHDIFKFFSWPSVTRFIHGIFVHGVSGYFIPRYVFAVFTIFFHSSVKSFLTENVRLKLGGSAFNLWDGSIETRKSTLIPIVGNRVQTFKFSNYFIPEYSSGFSRPIFFVVSVCDITNKRSKKNGTNDRIYIVENDFSHLFRLPWSVWLIVFFSYWSILRLWTNVAACERLPAVSKPVAQTVTSSLSTNTAR